MIPTAPLSIDFDIGAGKWDIKLCHAHNFSQCGIMSIVVTINSHSITLDMHVFYHFDFFFWLFHTKLLIANPFENRGKVTLNKEPEW